jgi:class 3 adenylate cyclase/tetratricopeptide (TPR) repeat protein
MVCPECGTENRAGRRFCSECGRSLAVPCPSCGTANEPTDKFCGECGTTLTAATAARAPEAAGRSEPQAERRLVSVLFADLVGFTTFSEHRDAEEVRDLLSRYFDLCRRIIARYGGTVEKFIGDAVMAVWGAPTAQEDDAERAVRAGLELTAAVGLMGDEVGAHDLRARVGVLTGEAAVTLEAEGQGMVAGDLVNTASRIQSTAEPGTVLVGDATWRATEAAVAYEDAGTHRLKGKEEPVQLWKATRVVGTRRGALRARGLEAPFVGRDREMRLVKELFHASAEEGRAHLVSVIGVAGVGKTRLSWEFERYVDGLADDFWWHRGRCLAYGEGVAYWALAEMVRSRAGMVEAEEPEAAAAKLRATVEEHIPERNEREWVEPRLAHLLGLEERSARDQTDLFAAWRLFFERLADQGPVVMIFEDLQWADTGLLDFIEYLLEWSRDHPIFILTLSRPDLTDRRPTWGAGKGSFTTLPLEPLSATSMDELMGGLVPGLPAEITASILARAEGIPLYAVETVRMLLDRRLLDKVEGGYRLAGRIEELEVPESLHALIAARLDGVAAEERRLLQDAAVLGKTFTKPALTALDGIDEARLDSILTALVRKELLFVQADPRSPERGQYGFLQDLVKKVAYETISKKERKAKHLAVADYILATWAGDEDEIVEVVASHLLEAYRSAPDAPDAEEIKARARESIARAGQRAASLAANVEAQRYFGQAAELADDPLTRAEFLEWAGRTAWAAGQADVATAHLERAIESFESQGRTHEAARVSARLAEITWAQGRIEEAVERMERSFEVLAGDEPDEGLASLGAQLGRLQYFTGQTERAMELVEYTLELAEGLQLPEVLSQALNTKALILDMARGRPEEGLALLRHALLVAREHDVPVAALRAYYNLSNTLFYRERYQAFEEPAEQGLALAERIGDRSWELNFRAEIVGLLFMVGRWDEALERFAEIPAVETSAATRFAATELLVAIPQLLTARGETRTAAETISSYGEFAESADFQEKGSYAVARAAVLGAQGKVEEALAAALEAVETRGALGPTHAIFKAALVQALEAAMSLGRTAEVERLVSLVDGLGAGETTPFLQAQSARFRALMAAGGDGSQQVDGWFEEAEQKLGSIGVPFWLGTTLVDHGEWLGSQGRTEEARPLLAEARSIFEELEARPWIDRVDRSLPVAAPAHQG